MAFFCLAAAGRNHAIGSGQHLCGATWAGNHVTRSWALSIPIKNFERKLARVSHDTMSSGFKGMGGRQDGSSTAQSGSGVEGEPEWFVNKAWQKTPSSRVTQGVLG